MYYMDQELLTEVLVDSWRALLHISDISRADAACALVR